jgi:hypothetical protein
MIPASYDIRDSQAKSLRNFEQEKRRGISRIFLTPIPFPARIMPLGEIRLQANTQSNNIKTDIE